MELRTSPIGPRRLTRLTSSATGLLGALALAACGNVVPAGPSAQLLPEQATVAVGASHDVVVAACNDEFDASTIANIIIATTLLTALGRIDAPFYAPAVLDKALGPHCHPGGDAVLDIQAEGDAWHLEPTENTSIFRATATKEGRTRITARLEVDDEVVVDHADLRAVVPNRVTLTPKCTAVADGTPQDPTLVAANASLTVAYELFHDDVPLAGYDLFPFDSPEISLAPETQSHPGATTLTVGATPGPFTITSSLDPTFALTLTTLTPADIDAIVIEPAPEDAQPWFVGQPRRITVHAAVGGQVPCQPEVFATQWVIETPDVCVFNQTEQPAGMTLEAAEAVVRPIARGTCQLRFEHPASGTNTTIERETFDTFMKMDPTREANDRYLGLWVAAPDTFYVAGTRRLEGGSVKAPLILRHAAGTWTRFANWDMPLGLRSIHGSSEDGTVAAVGEAGLVLINTGADWVQAHTGETTRSFTHVWVASAKNIYALGEAGLLMHFDGATWSADRTFGSADLGGLWMDATGAVYAGSSRGVHRKQGGDWETILPPGQLPTRDFLPRTIRGTSPSDIWVSTWWDLWHFDGQDWTQPDLGLDTVADTVFLPDDGVTFVSGAISGRARVLRVAEAAQVELPILDVGQLGAAARDIYLVDIRWIYHYHHDPALDP